MELTNEEKAKLKENCLAIRDYLTDLVKDYPTGISLEVKFYRRKDNHNMGISVRKYNYNDNKIEVRGFIGGLGIYFDDVDDDSCYRTTAWKYTDYGLELLPQWASIKAKFIALLAEEKQEREQLLSFTV